MSVSLISWNVNGIRAAKEEALELIKSEKPDVIGFQEIKADEKTVPREFYDLGYEVEINPAEKKGYSGTMSLAKKKPISVLNDFDDSEGRVQVLEFSDFYFINSYFPNSRRDLSRLTLKREFNARMLDYIKKLERKKPVAICGDFNVAHEEIDIARPKENEHNAGFTAEERADMDSFIGSGLVDTFRIFNSEPGNYTWWSYMFKARDKNIGWRIDYFLISKKLKEKAVSASILKDIKGSDHVPIKLILDCRI
ncbi:MAG: exodeoxyribonuclease III [Candidatus Micrarchaeum sp. ARMAN-1]|jgi:exodeoxyribonuclease-3|nr:MAG: exodeoxyribonuclease III [Candidatus Micrarchaeum sp. ARMAN-1]